MARAPQTDSHAGKPRAQAGNAPASTSARLRARFSKFIGNLGPGLISGASDDDPSGISTYSMAGASFGYGMLWTALFSFPLIAAMQLMSARLGTVKGKGLGALVRECYPGWVLWGTCILLVIASLMNASADLAGMAEATQLATGTRAAIWTVIYTAVITTLMFGASYRRISNIFRWLTLVLFAYVITAFLSGFDWKAAVHATLLPHLEWSKDSLAMFVGIMGTTISPFLFFWQATQEVEEKNAARKGFSRRAGSTSANLRQAGLDVGIGMFISNAIMYFIILTAAATLHAHGKTHIQTAREAAEALRPLAGSGAYWIFTLGLIGTGMLAIPALIGSSAYAVSEAAQWRGSLEKPPWRAWHFYGFIAASMAVALALDFTGIGAVRMLFWAAILNGVLSPPVILLVVLLSSNPRVMGKRTNPAGLRWLGWTTFAVMSAASIGLFFTL